MRGVLTDGQAQRITGYIEGKIEAFAHANGLPVEVVSQRVAELLSGQTERSSSEDNVLSLRGFAPRAANVERGKVEVGTSSRTGGAQSGVKLTKTGKTRKPMSPEAIKNMRKAQQKRWAEKKGAKNDGSSKENEVLAQSTTGQM